MTVAKKLQIITATLIVTFAPTIALAATVTLTADTTLVLPSDGSTYTLSSGGTFDNVSVSGGSMTFAMSAGESVTITSPAGYKLNSNTAFQQTCSGGSTSLTLTASSDLDAVVTPVDIPCPGLGVSHAASSAASSAATSIAASTTPAVRHGLTSAQIAAILSLLASLHADQGVIASVSAALGGGISAASPGTATFTRDLTLGSTGADVRALQQYLNAHGSPIATAGLGSTGQETNRFGALTKAALAAFQKAHSIAPAAGYFGTLTRAYIAAHP